MSLQTYVPWIFGGMAISIAAMVSGAVADAPVQSLAGALLFAASVVASAWQINRPLVALRPDDMAPETLEVTTRRNLRLVGWVYLWGALALIAIYRGTGVRWQHGLQYAAGMALIGVALMTVVHLSRQPGGWLSRPRVLANALRLAIAHAVAAAGGLVFLIGSGKMASTKGDWAANQIFLAGGLAVLAVSILAVLTHLHLSRPDTQPASAAAHD